MLIQEMTLKVDMAFINAMLALFAAEKESEEAIQMRFQADLKSLDSVLIDFATQSSSDEQKHFYDKLHISPLKVGWGDGAIKLERQGWKWGLGCKNESAAKTCVLSFFFM